MLLGIRGREASPQQKENPENPSLQALRRSIRINQKERHVQIVNGDIRCAELECDLFNYTMTRTGR
jgi:hypothetical protein